jgi:hypothetical protein
MSDEQTTKQESILSELTFNNMILSFELDDKLILFFKQEDKITFFLKQDKKSIMDSYSFFYIEVTKKIS